jgi:predicted branched-subunit amino acid permease
MLAMRARLLVAALWAGSLWTIGYVVAPTLFLTLHDNVLAGTIVGYLLRTEGWLCIGCALVLRFLVMFSPMEKERKRTLYVLIVAMMLCAIVIYVGLQPAMANLKEAAGAAGLKGTPEGRTFGILHGASQLVYLVESVLAGVLLAKMR